MAIPNTTVRSERNAIGRPEKGVRMIKAPMRMSVLDRDIGSSIPSTNFFCKKLVLGESGHNDDHKLATDGVGMRGEMRLHLGNIPGNNLFVHLRELASDGDSRHLEIFQLFQ